MPAGEIFNEICYIARYPDLRQNLKINPLEHFQNFGMAEGRVGGCDLPGTIYSDKFDSVAYINRYPDLKGTWAQTNPLLHFQQYGSKEGRKPGFEIITETTPKGLVSPGTTIFVSDHVDSNVPGDGKIPIIPGNETPPVVPGGIIQTIEKNPIIAAAIGSVILILLFKKKQNKR